MVIGFHRLNHGDNAPFDGPGGTLGHSYAPTNGRFHYDANERWSTNPSPGVMDLESVAVHKIGHSSVQETCLDVFKFVEAFSGRQFWEQGAALKLRFLKNHFLLASINKFGQLRYQDVTMGLMVGNYRTGLGRCDVMQVNPFNAVVGLGHSGGKVTMWKPTSATPLVKMLCHQGPISAIAFHPGGHLMATAGMERKIKLWDLRKFEVLHTYPGHAKTLDFSQKGLLSIGNGSLVQIWRDPSGAQDYCRYMSHSMVKGYHVGKVLFQPYEDVLGLGHSMGMSCILVPGSGEPNFDSWVANPFETSQQRKEKEIHSLLDKLPPETIMLDPTKIGSVRPARKKEQPTKREREAEMEAAVAAVKSIPLKKKTKGRNKPSKMEKKRKEGIVRAKRPFLEQQQSSKKQRISEEVQLPKSLQRFARMIMGASTSSVWYNLRVPHPCKDVPILDYELALLFQPMLMLGITIGVALSVVFPFWLITILIIILFMGTSSRSCFKGLEMWRQETILKKELAKQQATLVNSHGELLIDAEYDPLVPREEKSGLQILRFNLRWKRLVALLLNDTETCGTWYWVLNILQFPIAFGVFGYEATKLYKESKKRVMSGNTETVCEASIDWTVMPLAFCALCGILGGTVGGLLGSGGGFILGPLLLELGVIPQVASATATFVMMFSSSLSVVEFYFLQRFPIPYALYLMAVSVLAGFWGQYLIRKLVTLLKRASLIIFVLSAVIFASALTMGYTGIEKSIVMIHKHEYMGFISFCDN
ncbi:hypothetical protein HHK36_011285 [Tetracentron sinense]|uniref:BING4 C-terminal domain-containing protein n=1 Tax=Tetracentron sinense TaxID=13715 RepID=A0A835DG21_TETSI|nr:hypothetical protein HHK36_011285 [Tetracentron sinense]